MTSDYFAKKFIENNLYVETCELVKNTKEIKTLNDRIYKEREIKKELLKKNTEIYNKIIYNKIKENNDFLNNTLCYHLTSALNLDKEKLRTNIKYDEKNDKYINDYYPQKSIINKLPLNSFLIQFEFTLAKPFISKDDDLFNMLDNPIKRDKLTKAPYISASTWKGCLRHAVFVNGISPEITERIFGNDNEEKKLENIKKGRAHFYHSFFKKSDFEYINPHDRETRKGKNPIILECIPIKEESTFSVLYIPFGKNKEKEIIDKDLEALQDGIKTMFYTTGFGAKLSSGYGRAKIENFKKGNDVVNFENYVSRNEG